MRGSRADAQYAIRSYRAETRNALQIEQVVTINRAFLNRQDQHDAGQCTDAHRLHIAPYTTLAIAAAPGMPPGSPAPRGP